jgi:hypothetical protein
MAVSRRSARKSVTPLFSKCKLKAKNFGSRQRHALP